MEFTVSSTDASKETTGMEVTGSIVIAGLRYERVLSILVNQLAFFSIVTIARRILLQRASTDLMPRISTYKRPVPFNLPTAS